MRRFLKTEFQLLNPDLEEGADSEEGLEKVLVCVLEEIPSLQYYVVLSCSA